MFIVTSAAVNTFRYNSYIRAIEKVVLPVVWVYAVGI